MTSQVARDPKIQAGVFSAQRIKQGLDDIKTATKKGESSPENIDEFMSDLNSWYSNPDLEDKFTGTYSPYIDVDKYTKERFDAVKPKNLTYDEVFAIDPLTGKTVVDEKGRPVYSKTMKHLEAEGRLPEEVRATLDQIMSDPKIAKQLNITGKYIYKNANSDLLLNSINEEKNDALSNLSSEIENLNLRKMAGYDVGFELSRAQDRVSEINEIERAHV